MSADLETIMKTVISTLFMIAIMPSPLVAQCPKGADSCVTIVKPTKATGPRSTADTTVNNDARSEAISNRVSAATEAGLEYLLVLRPAMQAMQAEKTNRAEGQFAPIYEMLDSLLANEVPKGTAKAGAMPTIKGHRIGETWQQFVNNSHYLQTRVAKCAADKQPDPNRKVKRYEFNPCSNIWLMNGNPNANMTLDCVALGLGAGTDMICQDFSGEVSFEAGRLVSLKIVISQDWSVVYPDIVSKFGQPTGWDQDKRWVFGAQMSSTYSQ